MYEKIRLFRVWFSKLKDKKVYLELITASLSIPVLISVLFLNWNNIITNKNSPSPTPPPFIVRERDAPIEFITIIKEVRLTDSPDQKGSLTPEAYTPTQGPQETTAECIPSLGPIEILSPRENEVSQADPLVIDVNYDKGSHCSAVWSYRLNDGSFSEFIDDDITIYNLDPGEKELDLKVKSVVSDSSRVISRKFVYKSITSLSPTPTPTVFQSASPTPGN